MRMLFLPKNYDINNFFNAIMCLYNNWHFVFNNTQEPIPTEDKIKPEQLINQRALTFKEAEILVNICEGKTRKALAAIHKIKIRTIDFNTENI